VKVQLILLVKAADWADCSFAADSLKTGLEETGALAHGEKTAGCQWVIISHLISLVRTLSVASAFLGPSISPFPLPSHLPAPGSLPGRENHGFEVLY